MAFPIALAPFGEIVTTPVRNIAIVAHVDHGKTTLVDHMLRQAGVFRQGQVVEERVLDSVDQERERGITIIAKVASVTWKGVKFNIVDTPGHSDFGGEVERSLRLVDGILLLVDAAEGPLPQTRFVLGKAMAERLPVVVVINKIDRRDSRPDEVLDEIYGLFIDLGADEQQLDFPVLYAVARDGKAGTSEDDALCPDATLEPLFLAITKSIPPPSVGQDGSLQLLVSNIDHDEYVGRLAIGRVLDGEIRLGGEVLVCGDESSSRARVGGVYLFSGLSRKPVDRAPAGEIVAFSGISNVAIGDTICEPEKPRPLPRIRVDPPTLFMLVRVNDGPFAGKEGKYVTSRHLRERLFKESYRNVAIDVSESGEPDAFRIAGRGELQLAVLIEAMRREGYELTVSNPEPVLEESDGKVREPYELLVCDIPQVHMGRLSEILGARRARVVEMKLAGSDRAQVTWRLPARGLIGLRPVFLTETRGEGILRTLFDGYDDWAGRIVRRTTGAIVSDREGKAVPYGLFSLEDRGTFFVGPGEKVYQGMIVGEHSRSNDLDVNVCKTKKLTNIRAAGKDENVQLSPPRQMGLEAAIEWIDEDELVEATPTSIRLRKRHLDPVIRHRLARDRKFEAADSQ